MTVKTTAQMLQKFGTDLAETELPNDVQCTKDLLTAHTDKHSNLKVIQNMYQNTHRQTACRDWLGVKEMCNWGASSRLNVDQ